MYYFEFDHIFSNSPLSHILLFWRTFRNEYLSTGRYKNLLTDGSLWTRPLSFLSCFSSLAVCCWCWPWPWAVAEQERVSVADGRGELQKRVRVTKAHHHLHHNSVNNNAKTLQILGRTTAGRTGAFHGTRAVRNSTFGGFYDEGDGQRNLCCLKTCLQSAEWDGAEPEIMPLESLLTLLQNFSYAMSNSKVGKEN